MDDKRVALESRLQKGCPRHSPQPSRVPQVTENRQGSPISTTVQTSTSPQQPEAPSNLIEAKESIAECICNGKGEKRSLLIGSAKQQTNLITSPNDPAHEKNKEKKPGGGITMHDRRAVLESRVQLVRPSLSPRTPSCQRINAQSVCSESESDCRITHPSSESGELVQAVAQISAAKREIPDDQRSLLCRSSPPRVQKNSLDASAPKKDGLHTTDDKRSALGSRLHHGGRRCGTTLSQHVSLQKSLESNDNSDDAGQRPDTSPLPTPASIVEAKAAIASASRENLCERRHLLSRSDTLQNERLDSGSILLEDPLCADGRHSCLDNHSIGDANDTLDEKEESLTSLLADEQFQQKLAPGAFAIGSESSLVLSFRSNTSGTTSNYRYSQKSWKSKEESGNASLTESDKACGLAKAIVVDESPFMPAAIEFDPDGKGKTILYRRLLPKILLAFVLVGGLVVAYLLFRERSQSESRRVSELREILRTHELFDETSPAFRKALSWISDADELTLQSDHPLLLQRFILAHLYFTTTVDSNWTVCNPPQVDEDAFCRSRLQGIGNRWMTGTLECNWVGIKCNSDSRIIRINCFGMGLSGHVPNYLVLLSELEKVALSGNKLNGQIPSLLPRSIKSLVIGDNSLTGPLPPNLAEYSSLTLLELSRNSLSGRIPAELPDGLVNLDFSENSLTGSIPFSIFNLHKLTSLRLNDNSLVGSIASHVGILSSLNTFSVGSNILSGTIPDQLYGLTRLEKLSLSGNRINGSLSEQLSKLTMLVTLDVRDNRLSGTVPADHGEYPRMNWVFLSGNDLFGSIPDMFCPQRAEDVLEADCKPDYNGTVEIQCSCCSICCNNNGKQCHNPHS